ncbi:MAG: rhomboid family intramembrane serine protease [Candidatus Dadabacteria bacterium]|nr:MAG: rhomboid family intramembrane serine protease [Candidatus Dadabacteria bacterium]
MFPIKDTIPSRNEPVATFGLIFACTVIFGFELLLPEELRQSVIYRFGVVPIVYQGLKEESLPMIVSTGIIPLFSSMFLHAGLLHIVANMWTLWIFGDNVEDRMGPFRFVIFYLICGLVAGIVHVIFNPNSTIPTIGASGAISGVMGAYLLMFPLARIIVMIPILFYPLFFEVPAVFFMGIWAYLQLITGISSVITYSAHTGGVAWWAHLGGFACGLVLAPFFDRGKKYRKLEPDEYGIEFGW